MRERGYLLKWFNQWMYQGTTLDTMIAAATIKTLSHKMWRPTAQDLRGLSGQ